MSSTHSARLAKRVRKAQKTSTGKPHTPDVDLAIESLHEAFDILCDDHDGADCIFLGGDGCLACIAQAAIQNAHELLTGYPIPPRQGTVTP